MEGVSAPFLIARSALLRSIPTYPVSQTNVTLLLLDIDTMSRDPLQGQVNVSIFLIVGAYVNMLVWVFCFRTFSLAHISIANISSKTNSSVLSQQYGNVLVRAHLFYTCTCSLNDFAPVACTKLLISGLHQLSLMKSYILFEKRLIAWYYLLFFT